MEKRLRRRSRPPDGASGPDSPSGRYLRGEPAPVFETPGDAQRLRAGDQTERTHADRPVPVGVSEIVPKHDVPVRFPVHPRERLGAPLLRPGASIRSEPTSSAAQPRTEVDSHHLPNVADKDCIRRGPSPRVNGSSRQPIRPRPGHNLSTTQTENPKNHLTDHITCLQTARIVAGCTGRIADAMKPIDASISPAPWSCPHRRVPESCKVAFWYQYTTMLRETRWSKTHRNRRPGFGGTWALAGATTPLP